MRPTFVRIDDRLLHGQVLVAWAAALRPHRILLASDAVAQDPNRRALYAEIGSGDYAVSVEALGEAAAELRRNGRREQGLLVVVGSIADALQLVEMGAELQRLNIGGLHDRDSKRELLPYVYLSEADTGQLRDLLARGIEVEARDLPGSRGVRIDAATLDRLWS